MKLLGWHPPLTALYRLQNLAYRTQYAELEERARAAGALLPGTPGTLYGRHGTGYGYWYRVYYPTPGQQAEDLLAASGDEPALASARKQIDFAQWMSKEVSDFPPRPVRASQVREQFEAALS